MLFCIELSLLLGTTATSGLPRLCQAKALLAEGGAVKGLRDLSRTAPVERISSRTAYVTGSPPQDAEMHISAEHTARWSTVAKPPEHSKGTG